MKKVTFGEYVPRSEDELFANQEVYVDGKYSGFVEYQSMNSFVYWELLPTGKGGFVGGHIGTYKDGVSFDSMNELVNSLKK